MDREELLVDSLGIARCRVVAVVLVRHQEPTGGRQNPHLHRPSGSHPVLHPGHKRAARQGRVTTNNMRGRELASGELHVKLNPTPVF